MCSPVPLPFLFHALGNAEMLNGRGNCAKANSEGTIEANGEVYGEAEAGLLELSLTSRIHISLCGGRADAVHQIWLVR